MIEYFTREYIATYPDGPPFDKFTCDFCGRVFIWQSCGAYFGEISFEETIEKNKQEHLKDCPEFFSKLKSGEILETLRFNLG